VEQINRELKTDLGLGEHQVSKEEGRIEKFFGMAALAYLLVIRVCHQEILPTRRGACFSCNMRFAYG